MEYTSLGRSGLQVSRLCLGTMNFGTKTDKQEAFKIMDLALDLGINFFDTANQYGYTPEAHAGLTVEIIGEWFSQGNLRREKVILATKLHNDMGDPSYGPNDKPGLSAYKIRRQLEDSLRRLNTDHVELYQMHHIDRSVSWEELWPAFDRERVAGKVDYIGSCNFGARHLAYAQSAAKEFHVPGLVSEQHKYHLMCRLPELEVLPTIQDLGLGMMVWSPLASGLLAGNHLQTSDGRRNDPYNHLSETEKVQLDRYSAFCAKIGEKEADVALAWLLHQSAVTCPIIGPRTVEQLKSSVHALEISLDSSQLNELNEIFPGYRESPEEYAW